MADRTVESTQESVAQPETSTRSGAIRSKVSCNDVRANGSFNDFSTTTSSSWRLSSGRNDHPAEPRSKPSPVLPQCLTQMTLPDCLRTIAVAAELQRFSHLLKMMPRMHDVTKRPQL